MRVRMNEQRNHIIITGEMPLPSGVSGKPGWYFIELNRQQAMTLAGKLYALAQELDR